MLKQNLSLFDLSMIAIGAVIGSGIFVTPSLVFKSVPSPLWALGLWTLVGITGLAGALSTAELGGMMPRSGGLYVYLSETYGDLFGFLYGWIYLTVVNTGSLAAIAITFAAYLGYFFPVSAQGIKIIAISGIILLTIINVRGVKIGALFSDTFTVLKIAGIAGLIFVGFLLGTKPIAGLFSNTMQSGAGSGAFALAMVGVLFSYGGWHHSSFLAAEAKNPQRNVPLAMVIGALTVTVIYVLTNVAYLLLLAPTEIAASSRVAADAVSKAMGPVGGSFIAMTIFISTFGTSCIYTMSAPRIYFAMAGDKLFFRKVAELHPKYGTPWIAIISQSVWAICLILFWGTFENLISYVVSTEAIFFALAAAAVYILRRTRPRAPRPYKTWGYPITPLLYISIEVWFVCNIFTQKPWQFLAGLGFVLLGIPVFYYWKRRQTP